MQEQEKSAGLESDLASTQEELMSTQGELVELTTVHAGTEKELKEVCVLSELLLSFFFHSWIKTFFKKRPQVQDLYATEQQRTQELFGETTSLQGQLGEANATIDERNTQVNSNLFLNLSIFFYLFF